ncbi:MAG: PTS sugar transporter subunit IIA, partial [Gemmatimonadetes bacterium]|nr:PTS sugar transporter subunit IIA [Gemmatimonadota bacterium]
GDGIAIPHVRNPIIIHVSHPLITACLLRTPIDFGASDQQPVHTVFTLVSPSVHSHLRALAQLSFALRDETLRQMLRERAPADELLDRVHVVEQRTTSWYHAITDEGA